MKIDNKDIATASRVCKFMERLAMEQHERWSKVRPQCIPFGDLAYGMALMRWYQDGRPKHMAWFSYAEGEVPCPYLMEFRKEISEEFGLPILTAEEAKEEQAKYNNIITRKVCDWGAN